MDPMESLAEALERGDDAAVREGTQAAIEAGRAPASILNEAQNPFRSVRVVSQDIDLRGGAVQLVFEPGNRIVFVRSA